MDPNLLKKSLNTLFKPGPAALDPAGYDDDYLGCRTEIELLCDDIIKCVISPDDALRQYEIIERSFYIGDPERIELFRMIYKNRIERLCRQFLLEEIHGH